MTNTSGFPISVDGVRLDTLGWNLTKITPQRASRRSYDQLAPSMDGVFPSLHDTLEPSRLGLDMWVRGSDSAGRVPAKGSQAMLRSNLDDLLAIFGKRHALLEVRESVDGQFDSHNWFGNPLVVDAGGFGLLGAGTVGYEAASGVPISGSTGGAVIVTAAGGAGIVGTSYAYARPGDVVTVVFPFKGVAGTSYVVSGRARTVDDQSALGEGFSPSTFVASGAWQVLTLIYTYAQVMANNPTRDGEAFQAQFQVLNVAGNASNAMRIGQVVSVYLNENPQAASYAAGFWGGKASDASAIHEWLTPFGANSFSPTRRAPRTLRRAYARALDVISPELDAIGSTAQFTVGLDLPYALWEEVATRDWALPVPMGYAANGGNLSQFEVDTLRGSAERVSDAVILFTPTATVSAQVTISDPTTGAYVALNQAMGANQTWRVNVGTWSSRILTGAVTLDSTDADGVDVSGNTYFGGLPTSGGPYLPLTPVYTAGMRRVTINVKVTSSSAGTYNLSMRARRKYGI